MYCGLTMDYLYLPNWEYCTYWPCINFIYSYTDTCWCCLTLLKRMFFMSVYSIHAFFGELTYNSKLPWRASNSHKSLERTLISSEISLIWNNSNLRCYWWQVWQAKLSDQINGWSWRVLVRYCQFAPSSSGMWIAMYTLFSCWVCSTS